MVCDWIKYGHCKTKKCVEKECDLYGLDYKPKTIKAQIKKELRWIWKNKRGDKKIIKDKLMGIKVMNEAYIKAKRLGL